MSLRGETEIDPREMKQRAHTTLFVSNLVQSHREENFEAKFVPGMKMSSRAEGTGHKMHVSSTFENFSLGDNLQ